VEGLREEEEAVIARGRHSKRAAHAIALAIGLSLGVAGGDARADDQSAAEELFERGRKLMENNATLNEACRTLQDSLKLWDRGDTVLNLAECHRRQGRTATAWFEFDRALSHGTKVHFPEAIVAATRLRDALAARLSKLTVAVPPATAAIAGLTVEVETTPLPLGDAPTSPPQTWPRDRWNTGVVLDPGRVRVTAHAKGYKPFEAEVELGADKDAKSIVVVLEVEPPPPPPPRPPPPPPGPPAQPRPLWPWAVGAVGVALGGGAIVAEAVSRQAHDELDAKCGAARLCPRGYDFNPARTRELAGFGLFVGMGAAAVVAVGAAGVGLVLPVVSARAPGTSLVVSPASLAVRTTF
jgi:hypothetical protein